ncbi:DUF3099 domain-containing protein [Actinospica sp. MGRD01-02]|uniref:DUF3099 domain-containing protein n=1 Tax=Actinospica acidithermotolerans TaxID=2828514 RepID=A0A941E725_9ACTN|nr:DUF3099 domain-containing protein [Actinospica acidithermotolerans]MBR7827540.1 DUF3099 domain-containing protein [Actinospica acidithermotolerans]
MRLSISRHRRHQPAYGITTADGSHLDEVARRQKQYAATMGFRVVAILVVVFVPGLTIMERVILGLVATIIPYVAVIRANGAPTQDPAPTNLMIGGPRQGELPGPERGIAGSEGARGGADDQEPSAEWAADEDPDDDLTERQQHRE